MARHDDDDAPLSGSKRSSADISVDERLRRSRERNREHARRTRQRKKAQLQTLQARVAELQEEGARLEEALKDCSTANILLGLSNPALAACVQTCFKSRADAALTEAMATTEESDEPPSPTAERPGSPAAEEHAEDPTDDGEEPASASASGLVGARPTIHWKNGYTLDANGGRKNLSPAELDKMRRERNRLHAKMTRDRKKVYIETLSRAVSDLEEENRKVRRALALQLDATVGEPQRYLTHLGVARDDEALLPC
mmetsp:Transcript_9300/g.27846  ORF Transcript_9300/g.27846 Transcript_9300/m.27846 type:complete len:255 (-) Transcript_9300:73-837(-)